MNKNEVYFRLLYYYFIKPDDILSRITQSKEFREYNNLNETNTLRYDAVFSDLLDFIFDTIFEYSLPYTGYLDNNNPAMNTFFGESWFLLKEIEPVSNTPRESYNQGALSVIKFTIQSHLIIKSFFKLMEDSSNTLLPFKKFSFLSKDEEYFKHGYFVLKEDLETTREITADVTGTNDRVKCNNRYHKFINTPDSCYSKQLLTSVCTIEPAPNQKQHEYLTITAPLHQYAYFLYTNKQIHILDKALLNGTTVIGRYNHMIEAYNKNILALEHNADKLLFSYPMEKAYGLSTFEPVYKLLKKVTCTELSQTSRTYKDLDDYKFIQIVQQFLELPLEYSRTFLLNYACDAIIYGSLAPSRYLEVPSSTVATKSFSNVESKIGLINSGLILMEKFVQNLKYITLPLLDDLWTYILDSLNECIDNKELRLSIQSFLWYIDNHITEMTYDYTLLNRQTICSLSHHSLKGIRVQIQKLLSNQYSDLVVKKLEKEKKGFRADNYLEILLSSYCSSQRQPEVNHSLIYDLCTPYIVTPQTPGEVMTSDFHIQYAKLLNEFTSIHKKECPNNEKKN